MSVKKSAFTRLAHFKIAGIIPVFICIFTLQRSKRHEQTEQEQYLDEVPSCT
jgi:hypothetical protein